MDFSLRLDILERAEVHYLNRRERFRDWPPFVLLAASRQAQIFAYMSRDVVEHLHQQILTIEEATGLDRDEEEENILDDARKQGGAKTTEGGGNSAFSPSFAQTLDKLNELARQHLPEDVGNDDPTRGEALGEDELAPLDEEDALEQLQDAFIQIMEVVSELAGELSTDALQLTSRLRCARTHLGFFRRGQLRRKRRLQRLKERKKIWRSSLPSFCSSSRRAVLALTTCLPLNCNWIERTSRLYMRRSIMLSVAIRAAGGGNVGTTPMRPPLLVARVLCIC